MRHIYMVLILLTLWMSVVEAETVVRHERTIHGTINNTETNTATTKMMPEKQNANNVQVPTVKAADQDDEVIVVYGPWASRESTMDAEAEKVNSSQELGRIYKFIGEVVPTENPWYRTGLEEGVSFCDSIYFAGGNIGTEKYLVALRRQDGRQGWADDRYSLIIMQGRGQNMQMKFVTDKLPILYLQQQSLPETEHIFTQAWVRLGDVYMLRMDKEKVMEAMMADKGRVVLKTTVGEQSIDIPKSVLKSWSMIYRGVQRENNNAKHT